MKALMGFEPAHNGKNKCMFCCQRLYLLSYTR